jgi:hypothetical protein
MGTVADRYSGSQGGAILNLVIDDILSSASQGASQFRLCRGRRAISGCRFLFFSSFLVAIEPHVVEQF